MHRALGSSPLFKTGTTRQQATHIQIQATACQAHMKLSEDGFIMYLTPQM